MPTIKELRLRIKSLQNTSKITSAMKLVSASRLRKAQEAFNRNRPYAEKIKELLDQITASFQDLDHPLMKAREVKRIRYYVLASDRGLAGSFNNNLIKYYVKTLDRSKETQSVGLGRRTRDFINRNGLAGGRKAELPNTPTFANASAIANEVIRDFLSGEVDQVVLVYNRFKSALSQVPTHVQLLPFARPEKPAAGAPGRPASSPAGKAASGFRLDYIVEPGPAEVFGDLLPKLVTIQVYKSLLENAVGEHTARMTAMDSATKNTKELIGSLTLKMNRARQAAITKELIEIVSGAEALKG